MEGGGRLAVRTDDAEKQVVLLKKRAAQKRPRPWDKKMRATQKNPRAWDKKMRASHEKMRASHEKMRASWFLSVALFKMSV